MYTKRVDVGLNESLVPLHQQREIVMVALIVDPDRRCLVIDGGLPTEAHVSLGAYAHKGILPFVNKLVEPKLRLRTKRVYQLARIYDPHPEPVRSDVLYVVVRVDVADSPLVPGGEWVGSAERAEQIGGCDPLIRCCAQLFLAEHLAWQSSASLATS